MHLENLKNMMTISKEFDSIKYMRNQRNILADKLLNMTNDEVVAYFQQVKLRSTVKPSA
jgi:hypothetical protein